MRLIAPFPLIRYISIVGIYIDMANNTGIKYGGKQKGTPNKATARLREAFTELLEDNMGRLQELLDKVAEKNPQN